MILKLASIGVLLSSLLSLGQIDSSIQVLPDHTCEQVQISDFIHNLLKFKKKKQKDSAEVKQGKLYFAVLPGLGYTLQSHITAVTSMNISLYASDPQKTNLSTFNTDIEYAPIHKQLFVPMIFNIWLKNNSWNIVNDTRYYKFPSLTYGLGSLTTLSKADKIEYSYFKFHLIAYKPIKKFVYLGLGYNLDYHWNISTKDNNTDFNIYNQRARQSSSSGLWFSAKYDSRHNVNNPQGGLYISSSLRTNFRILGSNHNWNSLLIDARKYIKLHTKRSNIFAFWVYSWFTFNKNIPYWDLPSSGWDTYSNVGRGYIQGRLRGKDFLYFESEYRFDITRNGLFGGVLFANVQTVSEIASTQFKRALPAIGTGLRVKVNKKSNVNFAIDYAIGINGSRGFFFDVCEVF